MKAAGLIYGLDERPPAWVSTLSGLQYIVVIAAVGTLLPILVAERAGASAEARDTVVGITLLAAALGTLLQCYGRRGIGSGFLLPATATAAYMPASLAAAERGGLSLVCGMTIFAGLCTIVMSRTVRHLRAYLPPEVAGLAVTVIGLSLGTLGFRLVFDQPMTAAPGPVEAPRELAGVAVLAVAIALSVWSAGILRLFAVLLGFVAGCAVAAPMGILVMPDWMFDVRAAIVLPPPFAVVPSFDPMLIPDFLFAALACALHAVGDVTTCQRINDPRWTRPDLTTIRGGLLADGLSTMVSGLLGGVGLNTSSSSVGVSAATGVTARRVAIFVAVLLAGMALAPRPRAFLAAVPQEVAGGIMLFAACFIIMNGIRIIMGRMLDARRTVMVGLALFFGLSHELFPGLFNALPTPVAGLLGSELMVAMLTAIGLDLLFRIGVARRAESILTATGDPALPYAFMERHGTAWGARRDVVARVTAAIVEFREHMGELMPPDGTARMAVRFDEFAIDLVFRWVGAAPVPPTAGRPAPESLLRADPDEAAARLRTLLLTRLADTARVEQQHGEVVLRLRFEH